VSERRQGVVNEIMEAARALEREAGFPHDYLERVRSALGRSSTQPAQLSLREAVLHVIHHGVFDVNVPTASPRPGVGLTKRGVKRVTAWYFRYLEEQMNAFGRAVAGLGETVASQLEGLETRLGEVTGRLDELQTRIERLEGRAEGK
jgi:hypothetical protein